MISSFSKLPPRLWFKAMYLITQSKKGISSIELGRRLGVTQTRARLLRPAFMPSPMRSAAFPPCPRLAAPHTPIKTGGGAAKHPRPYRLLKLADVYA